MSESWCLPGFVGTVITQWRDSVADPYLQYFGEGDSLDNAEMRLYG